MISPMTSTQDLERLAELLADRVAERVAERLQHLPSGRLMTRKEYAQARRLGIRTIDRAIADNRLPVVRQGRRVLIPADAEIERAPG